MKYLITPERFDDMQSVIDLIEKLEVNYSYEKLEGEAVERKAILRDLYKVFTLANEENDIDRIINMLFLRTYLEDLFLQTIGHLFSETLELYPTSNIRKK